MRTLWAGIICCWLPSALLAGTGGDPTGEVCPRSFDLGDGATASPHFDEIHGAVIADTPIGCRLSAKVGEGRTAWVGLEVPRLAVHLIAEMELDIAALDLAGGEEVDVLGLFPGRSLSPVATVSIRRSPGGDLLAVLRWTDDSGGGELGLAVVEGSVTLSLWLERGAVSQIVGETPGGRLLLRAEEGLAAAGGLLFDGVLPPSLDPREAPTAVVRMGLLGFRASSLGGGPDRGRVRFRPLGIETGWGRL